MVAIPLRRGKALSWGLVVPSGNSSMSWLGRNALSTLHSLYQSAGHQQRRFRLSFKALVIDYLGSKQLEACFMTAARRKMTVQLKATKKKVKLLDSGLLLHRDGYEDCLSYQARRGIRCYRNFKTAFEGSTFFSYDKKEIEKGAYAILFLRLVASKSNWATDSFTSCFWHWV